MDSDNKVHTINIIPLDFSELKKLLNVEVCVDLFGFMILLKHIKRYISFKTKVILIISIEQLFTDDLKVFVA